MTAKLVYVSRAPDGLLKFDKNDPTFRAALGPVRLKNDRYQWAIAMNETDLPRLPRHVPTYGRFLHDRVDYTSATRVAGLLPVEGWVYTDVAWTDTDFVHPTAGYGTLGAYIDIETGDLTYRIETRQWSELRTLPMPAHGWDADDHGHVPALLGKLRAATIPIKAS